MRISDWSSDVCSSDLQKLRSFVVQASACHVEGLDMRRRQAADRVVIALADLEIVADDTAERHQRQGHGAERPVPGVADVEDQPSAVLDPEMQHEWPVELARGRSDEHTSELQSLRRNSY